MTSSKIRLRGIAGSLSGYVWETTTRLRVGRAPEMDIVLDDLAVSRMHAELVVEDQCWSLRDAGSSNGTLLNGRFIGTELENLKPGDVIQFGESTVIVEAIQDEQHPFGGNPDQYVIDEQLCLTWQDVGELVPDFAAKSSVVALMKAGRFFPSSHTLKDYLNVLLWEIAERFETSYSVILTANRNTNQIRVCEILNLGTEVEPDHLEFDSLVQQAFVSGVSLRGRDTQTGQAILTACLRHESARKVGVLYLARNASGKPFDHDDLVLAEALALCVSLTLQGALQTFEKQDAERAQLLNALAKIVGWQGDPLSERSRKVLEVALLIAEQLELAEKDKHTLRIGVPLYDLGMISVDDRILQKSGRLSPVERKQMQTHVLRGVNVLGSIPYLLPILPMVRHHHERWDGKGYPDGLAETNIPLLARIVAVADAAIAMVEARPYRARLSVRQALAELEKHKGSQFDPQCVEAIFQRQARAEEILQPTGVVEVTALSEELDYASM